MTKEIDETERYLNALINNEVMYNGLPLNLDSKTGSIYLSDAID